jgi:hypothetical protein
MSSDPPVPEPVEEASARHSGDHHHRKRIRKKAHHRHRLTRDRIIFVVIATFVILASLAAWHFLASLLD